MSAPRSSFLSAGGGMARPADPPPPPASAAPAHRHKRRRRGNVFEVDSSKHSVFLAYMPDRMTVEYNGLANHTLDVGAARCNYPFPDGVGIGYFEVAVEDAGEAGQVTVGLVEEATSLNTQPGSDASSFGYRGDQGFKYHNSVHGDEYGPTFGTGDVVGCGFNADTKEVFFTKNGDMIGTAYRDVVGSFYPAASVHSRKERVRFNFTGPFRFDLASMYEAARSSEREAVSKVELSPEVVPALIRDYLLHNGYMDTLKAFEARFEAAARARAGTGDDEDVHALDLDGDDVRMDRASESKRAVPESDSKRSDDGAGAGASAGATHASTRAMLPAAPVRARARSGSGSSTGSASRSGRGVRDFATHVSGMWDVFRRIYQRASRGRERRLRRPDTADSGGRGRGSGSAAAARRAARAFQDRSSRGGHASGPSDARSSRDARDGGGRGASPQPPSLPSYLHLRRARSDSAETGHSDFTADEVESEVPAAGRHHGALMREEITHLKRSTLTLRAQFRHLILSGQADAALTRLRHMTLQTFTACVFGLWSGTASTGSLPSIHSRTRHANGTATPSTPPAARSAGSSTASGVVLHGGGATLVPSPLKDVPEDAADTGTTAGSRHLAASPLMLRPSHVTQDASPPSLVADTDMGGPLPAASRRGRRGASNGTSSAPMDGAGSGRTDGAVSPRLVDSGLGAHVLLHLHCQRVIERLRQGRAQAALALARRELPNAIAALPPDSDLSRGANLLVRRIMGLVAFPDPTNSPAAQLLSDSQRASTADVVNDFLLCHAVRQYLRTKASAWALPRTHSNGSVNSVDVLEMAHAAVSAASSATVPTPAPPSGRPPMSPLDTGLPAPTGPLPPLLNVGQSAQPSTAVSTASIWSSSLAAATAQGRYRAMMAASEGAGATISPSARSIPTSLGTMSDPDEEDNSERGTDDDSDDDDDEEEEGFAHSASDVDMSTEEDSAPDTDDEDPGELRGPTTAAHRHRARSAPTSSAAAAGGTSTYAGVPSDAAPAPSVAPPPVSPLTRAVSASSATTVDLAHLAALDADLSLVQPRSNLEQCLRQLLTVHDTLRVDTGSRGSVFRLPSSHDV